MTLELRSINTPPDLTYSKSHYYCDYIELVALFGSDDLVSHQDIYVRFYDSGVINEESLEYGVSEAWVGSENASEYVQRWNDRILNWFNILNSRSLHYGDNYPFNVEHGTIQLKNDLTDKCKIYLGLLLASNLSYHNKRPLFTSIFEEISRIALQSYLGERAQVFCFGVSQLSNPRYTGSLQSKMSTLANDINHELTRQTHIFREGDNGDGGVDVVAWLPYPGDINISRKQLFLGQSATGKNWPTKQGSVVRIKNYINIPDNTQNVLFVPYDLRDNERLFEEDGEITACLVFDRLRIISLVNEVAIWSSEKGADFRETIEEAILFEDDLV